MVDTKVYIRGKKTKNVPIREKFDQNIGNDIKEKWQNIINLIAKILHVKSGLIMQITKEHMEVFLKSSNKDNPYPFDGKDRLGHGLYCESVIGENRTLYIENALENEDWKDNPDVDLDMISYLGYPIRYPNGDFFGTVCVLDDQKIEINDDYQLLLKTIRDSIETDLKLVESHLKLEEMANQDYLTKLPNRKKIRETVKEYQKEVHQGLYDLSMCMIDLDDLKRINDNYGHVKGDLVLKTLGKILAGHNDSFDLLGRLSGDEFFIVSKSLDKKGFKDIIEDILFKFENHPNIKEYQPSFSYGISLMKKNDEYYDKVKEADDLMYQRKRDKKKYM